MTKELIPGYYDQLRSNDVVAWVEELLTKGGWGWRYEDGTLVTQHKPGISDTPWHHVKSDHRLNCALWHQIMFDMVSVRMPQHLPGQKVFVPSKCQNCFKVVVRPKTLKQLFALVELEKRLDRPSKAGIEVRDTVHALYGGYFYNVGLVDGLECYEIVRKAVDEDPLMGPDIEVFLKRACTEYEHACGDSDTWEITKEQLYFESLIERYVQVEHKAVKQPEILIHHVHRMWIEYAYKNGDETYKEFTGGRPLYPKYKSYHHWLSVLREHGPEAVKIEGE